MPCNPSGPTLRLTQMGEAACRLHALLRVLPPVRHALAYGSGVFEQAGAPPDPTRMVDYLLVVSTL